jgi:hypothetical protein
MVFPILSVIDYSWIRRIVRLGGDLVSYNLRSVKGIQVQSVVRRTSPLQEAEMDGLRAEDQGVHIQHAFESRNDVGNWPQTERGRSNHRN